MEGQGAEFVVEVSNERHSDGGPYERWEVGSHATLAGRLQAELGWLMAEAVGAAEDVVSGRSFEDTDEETGKTVRAYVKQKAAV